MAMIFIEWQFDHRCLDPEQRLGRFGPASSSQSKDQRHSCGVGSCLEMVRLQQIASVRVWQLWLVISGLIRSSVTYSRLTAANSHLCQEEPSRFLVKPRMETEIDEKHTYDFDLVGWPQLSFGGSEVARLCCWTTDPDPENVFIHRSGDSAVAPPAVQILPRVTRSLYWPLAVRTCLLFRLDDVENGNEEWV
jgi:hypothetical protein